MSHLAAQGVFLSLLLVILSLSGAEVAAQSTDQSSTRANTRDAKEQARSRGAEAFLPYAVWYGGGAANCQFRRRFHNWSP